MKINKLYPPKNNSFVINLPFHSKNLFGALANSYVELWGDNTFAEFLQLFEKGKISSIFPAIQINGKEIFFLPKPFLSKKKIENESKDEQFSKKKIKKIKWFSFSAMNYLAKSIVEIDDEYFHTIDFMKEFQVIGDEFMILKSELNPEIIGFLSQFPFYKNANTIRVNVSRLGDDSMPFDQSELNFVFIKNNKIELQTFLYFFETIEDNGKWEQTKNLFIEKGIGGKRNLGKGFFRKIVTEKFDLFSNLTSKIYLLLSSTIPEKKELSFIYSYDTIVDDGFITYNSASNIKKDRIFCIKEGSVISNNIEGKIIKQQFEGKAIYRYGKAFLIPFGGNDE